MTLNNVIMMSQSFVYDDMEVLNIAAGVMYRILRCDETYAIVSTSIIMTVICKVI